MLSKNKKLLRKARQRLMKASPSLYIGLSKLSSKHFFFSKERAFLRGDLLGDRSQASFVFYAANRAGSMLLSRTLEALAVENGLIRLDLHRFFVHTDREQLELLNNPDWVAKHFLEGGFCFGPLRSRLPDTNETSIAGIAIIRDPRDIVVSHYYAVISAHTIFDRQFLKMKQSAELMSIDEYAISFAPEAFAQAIEFADLCERENHSLFRYEDFLADAKGVLIEISRVLGLNEPSGRVLQTLEDELKSPGAGDKTQHKRSGLHGQFRNELKPETVESLNRKFSCQLKRLKY